MNLFRVIVRLRTFFHLSNESFNTPDSSTILNATYREEEIVNACDAPRGEVYLTASEKRDFMARYPGVNIEFIRPGFAGKKTKQHPCLYRINNVLIPKNINQAWNGPNSSKWLDASNKEYLSLVHNNT